MPPQFPGWYQKLTKQSDKDSGDPLRSVSGIIREIDLPGSDYGLLSGYRFAAKDVFDVKGYVTGAGNPQWLATHQSAKQTAKSIDLMLDAGANLVGKTICDELTFSMDGINIHYGTPINPQLPDRIPGGSSSGSASVVAAKLVDFSLGTDTAGSVRIPASYCGIFGFRPTHGQVSCEGIVPLSPSFDTVGWLARTAGLLRLCGRVLLSDYEKDRRWKRLSVVEEAMELLDPTHKKAVSDAIESVRKHFAEFEYKGLSEFGLKTWPKDYAIYKGWEIWQYHGKWIEDTSPKFAASIQSNFDHARKVTYEERTSSLLALTRIQNDLNRLLDSGTVLCMPTAWTLPPLKRASQEELFENRKNVLKTSCISPVGGLPQVTIPIRLSDSVSIGLSFIAARGSDMMLLELAEELSAALQATAVP